MKTRYLKIDWLVPFLGIALVGGSLVAATTYLGLERKIHDTEAFVATLDRLYQQEQISAVLKRIHDGQIGAAVQRLDLLLCDDILLMDSELASADARTRAYVEDAFRRIALLRPKTAGKAAGSAQECGDDQAAAERILTLALAAAHKPETK